MSQALKQMQLDFLAAIREGHDQKPEILNQIVSTDDFNALQRFQVYRNSIRAGLLNSLEAVYPVCERLVGKAFFAAMANIYCDTAQSCSPDLNDFGADLPEFIQQFEPAAALPYFADVAHLEWAVHRCQLGANAEPINTERLVQLNDVQFEALVFAPCANGRIIASDYPIDKIWEVNQSGYAGDESVELAGDPCQLFIVSQQYQLHIQRLTAADVELMQTFDGEKNIADVIDACPNLAFDKVFPKLLSLGFLEERIR